MTNVSWAEPALIWGDGSFESMKKPQILELKTDDFLPEFLAAMQTAPNKQTHDNPVALSFITQNTVPQPESALKLFQPLHSRYYLVTASLVCEKIGLPDKDVNLKKGEKTSFVLRRINSAKEEQGWNNKDNLWVTIPNPNSALTPDEERFPLHPVSVCTGKNGGLTPCERKIHYGYIPTGNREKYLRSRPALTAPLTEAESSAALDRLWTQIEANSNEKRSDFNYEPIDPQTHKKNHAFKVEAGEIAAKLVTVEPQGSGQYFLRMVYEYDPACPPIISDYSHSFTFAKFFDSDAPARLVRIEMPSISNLGAFKHGVGIQMPNDLRKKIAKFSENNVAALLSGGPGPGDDNNLSLGMICTFSIQIITLIALILMLIIAFLLNIIFFWVPLLRICFPIPTSVPESS